MTRFLFAFAFLILLSCNYRKDKTYQPDIAETKSFFAQLDDSVLTKRSFLLVDTVQSELLELFVRTASYQKTLPKDDIEFIDKEFNNTPPSVWTKSVFDSAKIVSSDYIVSLKTSTGFPPHYSFSFPYFSKDKRHCVLYYSNYCGNLCTERSIRLYEYENGKWTLAKTIFSIVS